MRVSPIYSQAQPHSVLDTAKSLLERFKTYEDTSYLENMSNMLALVNTTESIEIKEGNIKLNMTISGDNAHVLMMYTENG